MGDVKVFRVPFEASESEFIEKRSRFISHLWPVETEEEAQAHIREMKSKYYDVAAVREALTSIVPSISTPFLENGDVDFVTTRNYELSSPNYSCIDSCEFYFEEKIHVYRLYKNVDLL